MITLYFLGNSQLCPQEDALPGVGINTSQIYHRDYIVFYHYILNKPADSLIHKFYQTQYAKSAKNDWFLTVKANLEMLQIHLSEGEIKKMSE